MPGMLLRFGALGSAQLAGSALSFLTAVIITRVGGAATFGQISVALSVLTYALLLTNFGTDISGVRMAASSPERIGAMLPAITIMRLFLATIAFITVLAFSHILASEPSGREILLIISAGVFASAFFPAWLPQAREDVTATALCLFGPFALTFLFTSLSALWAGHGIAFAVSRFAGDVLIAVAASLWAWRFFDGSGWTAIRGAMTDLLGQSSAIAGSELVRGLAFLSDVLIVSFFFHDTTVGHFAAAYRIYLLLIAVAAMYSIVLLPRLSRAANDGPDEIRAELRSTFFWTIPAATILTLVFMATVPWALPFAFGPDFSVAVPALQLLGITATLNFIHRNYSRTLIAMGVAGTDLQLKAIATFVGIGLKVLATWRWGITGTAIALLASEALLLVLLQLTTHRRLRSGLARQPRG